MLRWLLVCVSLVGIASCAVTSSIRKDSSTVDSASSSDSLSVQGRPGWVDNGATTVSLNGKRVFYGVGVASGITNPGLLRAAAGNRARAEVAKLFQVYSNTIMKDYMDSSGNLDVEQEIRTFVKMSLRGAEIVDRYVDASGTLYALCALDLERAQSVIRDSSSLKGLVTEEALEKSFDKQINQVDARMVPIATRDGDFEQKFQKHRPDSIISPVAPIEVEGGKPDWIDGYGETFPYERFLCSVGIGNKRQSAIDNGYGALARVFAANVDQVSQDFSGAYASTGAEELDIQSAQVLTKVSTKKVLQGAEPKAVWASSNESLYVLICLERSKMVMTLKERIRGMDAEIGRLLKSSKVSDKAKRLRKLSKAMEVLLQRESANGELRIISLNGIGLAGEFNHADIAASVEVAIEAIKIGIVGDGEFEEDFRVALIEYLSGQGYQVVADTEDLDLDVIIRSTIDEQELGRGSGIASSIHFVRIDIKVEVLNPKTGKIMGAITDQRKEGHVSVLEAKRRAVRELVRNFSGKLGKEIDSVVKGNSSM